MLTVFLIFCNHFVIGHGHYYGHASSTANLKAEAEAGPMPTTLNITSTTTSETPFDIVSQFEGIYKQKVSKRLL